MGKRKRFKRKGSKSSLQNSVANGSIEGLLAEQDVVFRLKRESRLLHRCRNRLSSMIRSERPDEFTSDDVALDTENKDQPRQYTIKRVDPRSFIFRHGTKRVEDYVYRPPSMLVWYTNWTFTHGFLTVFLSFLFAFLILVLGFAVLILIAGNATPECIRVSGENFGYNESEKFADAFALSWTTFTTVGYGMIYTATGTEHENQNECSIIIFLCTAESFIGLLYSGICTALLFGKVGRIESYAQVLFSNMICVQLSDVPSQSSGNEDSLNRLATKRAKVKDGNEDDVPQVLEKEILVPCPVLVFQVINELANALGGEILDASLKALVKTEVTVGGPITRLIKINLEEYEHPFFQRGWLGRHVLNASSPLLTASARTQLSGKENKWPADWNNPRKIRDVLDFHELTVIISGISNTSASTVHGYKRYKLSDTLVGYTFAPVLYKLSKLGKVLLDFNLIHDVNEQGDGRAETLTDHESSETIRWETSIY